MWVGLGSYTADRTAHDRTAHDRTRQPDGHFGSILEMAEGGEW